MGFLAPAGVNIQMSESNKLFPMWRVVLISGCLVAVAPVSAATAGEETGSDADHAADPLDSCVHLDPSDPMPVAVHPDECLQLAP